MRPCLVLNKLDRLVLEMRLSPIEAFHHMRRIVENANALAYSLVVSELRSLAEQQEKMEGEGGGETSEGDKKEAEGGDQFIEEDHPLLAEWTFAPEKGNVIFASALDCWGFGLVKFANLWSKKLEVNKAVLQKYLFEDYCFNAKTKKIVRYDPQDPNS
jgi:ribosome assembly protein 1